MSFAILFRLQCLHIFTLGILVCGFQSGSLGGGGGGGEEEEEEGGGTVAGDLAAGRLLMLLRSP